MSEKMGIESEEFYNLMQTYRCTPTQFIPETVDAYIAVIEYINSKILESKREGEPVAWMAEFVAYGDKHNIPFKDKDKAQQLVNHTNQGEVKPLFLSPQPKDLVLPSLEELTFKLADIYAQKRLTGGDPYRAQAEAILELLKEKNKNG